jgi:hypothetical protein
MPKFLPFDLQSFKYSQQLGAARADMENDLRNMNERILTQTNPTGAINDFVLAAYGATATPLSGNFIDNSFVAGWSSTTGMGYLNSVIPRDFYTSLVGPSCRTCHTSRSDFTLWFDTQGGFNPFPGAVCGSSKYMPNAKITFQNFWTSTNPNLPNEFDKFFNIAPGNCQ